MKAHKILTLAIAVAIGGVAVTHVPQASAQWAVFDPTNFVQNFLQQLRAVQSNLNEVKQLQHQIEQLRYEAENIKGLAGGRWDVGADSISRLERLLDEGEALAVSGRNFEGQFKQVFPAYKPEQDYRASYDKWSRTRKDSIFGAMRVANLQMTGIQDEQQALASLRSAARSTNGQKQALDAANQIALAQVAQMQQLRELMLAQAQSAGAQAAVAAQEAEAKRGVQREALKYRDPREGYKPQKVCAVPPCK